MLKVGRWWAALVLFAAAVNSTPEYGQSDALEKLRKQRDELRKKQEADKVARETEEARRKAEEARKQAEADLKKAEEERKKAEEERKKAEEERKKAEADKDPKPTPTTATTAKVAGTPTSEAKPAKVAEEKTEVDAGAADVPAELASLRLSRDARKKELLAKLRERWGALLDKQQSHAELTQHGRRMAFLQRMRALAEQDKKVKVVERVDKLITTEELRHGKAMNALR
jgi:hypothetical protein